MNLHFITSISKEYWYSTARYCINTWDLPGTVTVFVDQQEGDLTWISEIQADQIVLLNVPYINTAEHRRAKVRKFWGKSYSQIVAIKSRGVNERIVWIDSDVEQVELVSAELFNFDFVEPFAMLNSADAEDCWETGVVLFNQQYGKLNQLIKRYERSWYDDDFLSSLWRPYDTQVLGDIALDKGFFNLCDNPCSNANALENSRYSTSFTHWINKDNKKILADTRHNDNSSDIS